MSVKNAATINAKHSSQLHKRTCQCNRLFTSKRESVGVGLHLFFAPFALAPSDPSLALFLDLVAFRLDETKHSRLFDGLQVRGSASCRRVGVQRKATISSSMSCFINGLSNAAWRSDATPPALWRWSCNPFADQTAGSLEFQAPMWVLP